LPQHTLAIAKFVRCPRKAGFQMPIVEQVLGQYVDALAGVDQLDERLPVLEGGAAVGLETADSAEIHSAIDRVGIAIDVADRGQEVRSGCRPKGELELAPCQRVTVGKGEIVTR